MSGTSRDGKWYSFIEESRFKAPKIHAEYAKIEEISDEKKARAIEVVNRILNGTESCVGKILLTKHSI